VNAGERLRDHAQAQRQAGIVGGEEPPENAELDAGLGGRVRHRHPVEVPLQRPVQIVVRGEGWRGRASPLALFCALRR
jgi:hypothetical protein